jgi:hypothetical protein
MLTSGFASLEHASEGFSDLNLTSSALQPKALLAETPVSSKEQ